ncbi:MAG TPA: uroporphyrinogen decarboxylase family protein [Cyclobacteriaceae bacterium]|nr:uroporphyrinogen decarboxylase family protein [Cyclobacteriaceae bacterium]
MNKPKSISVIIPDRNFQPDYTHVENVLYNRRPDRLPLYEHHIDLPFISKALGKEITLQGNRPEDLENYYCVITGFWKDMTYDAFDYEAAICDIYPGHGAIMGGMKGPIQTRADFEKYPFGEIPGIFWNSYGPHLEAIRKVMPAGMRAYGGCGYGIFESAEDLVGFENLAVLQYNDPDLFSDLFIRIGDLYVELWTAMIRRYSDLFVFYRMGDDLGFKSTTLLEPETIRIHILPQYKRIIDLVHTSGKKFLLHSCGNIFSIMDDIIALGIDAKHSNEDEIAPFEKWIELYNDRIGLLGGIDVNILCLNSYDEVYRIVKERGNRFRSMSRGYGMGSGNSIASYVPVEGFMGMIDAVKAIRMSVIK